MARAFSTIAYTPSVRAAQQRYGSREANAAFDRDPDPRDSVTEREREFIAQRDHFFLASVGESGWPYVQHRGGPPGFLKILDERTLGFADFAGNRQYISAGNIAHDDRVMLFLIDYANRRRLKVWGRARIVHEQEDPALIARLEMPSYRARIERGFLIAVEAFDFNCPQHITPRYTEAEAMELLAAMRTEAAEPAPRRLGSGELALTIAGIRQLTPRVRAYELRRVDGGALPPTCPGAHLRVPVRLPDGQEVARAYSIVSVGSGGASYEIAVQREEGGRGGSKALHRDYALGAVLHCGPPSNSFPLHADARPSILIAGGIGITPLKVMAEALQAAQRPFHLYYSAGSVTDMAYRAELAASLGSNVSFHVSRGPGGRRLDLARVLDEAPANAVFYVCGPARLIDAVLAGAAMRGISPERVRYERFAEPRPRDGDRALAVTLARSGLMLRVAADQTILDAALAAGVNALSDCRTGTCGTCAVKVIAGRPDHRDSILTAAERDRAGLMCPCVSRASTEQLVLDM